MEQWSVLGHHPNISSQALQLQIVDVLIIDEYLASNRIVETV
jgi:hypothetical protein